MRELDTFGRILIPKEIRKELNINEGDKFIYKILLKKVNNENYHTRICESFSLNE